MLTNLGLVCEVACNGQEAVTLAENGAQDGRPFDVVLMDMAMPVMGGVEASRVGSPKTPFMLNFQMSATLPRGMSVACHKAVSPR